MKNEGNLRSIDATLRAPHAIVSLGPESADAEDAADCLVKISNRNIATTLQCVLWGRAAGRCEFAGCNKPLWKSSLTQEQINIAQKAHIYAFSSRGPRGGGDARPSDINQIQNLILVCHECHKKLDGRNGENRYPPDLLRKMKAQHERRIELVTGIAAEKRSHILLYGANIGDHSSPLNYADAAQALFPRRYPASDTPIDLNTINSAFVDRDSDFWSVEAENLIRKFDRRVRDGLAIGEITHLSVFAMAPQPLLVLLGTLLGDIVPSEIYQRHREPPTWMWPELPQLAPELKVIPPASSCGTPALVMSLSGTIRPERVTEVLGDDASIWNVSVDQRNNDLIKSPAQLSQLRSVLRGLFDQIKAVHGQEVMLHIFPAVSVSVATEIGRVRMPKVDMPWQLYDHVNGKFVPVLCIPNGASHD